MIRINLLEKQWPKHVRELDKALKEFQKEYNRVMMMHIKPIDYYVMTKEESNLRLLEYDEEISDIARQIKFFANPDFIYILYKDDKPAAFLLALPDINEILIKIKNGKIFPTGWFKLLFQRKHIKSGRVLLMGVRREFRNQGLDVLLYYQLLNDGLEKTSVEKIELSWILEDNKAMVSILKNLQADPYKRYLILKKMLDE